jgi:hypothetical protein
MSANKRKEKNRIQGGERERERERGREILKKRLRNGLNSMSTRRRTPTSVLVQSAKLFHHGFRLSTQGSKCDTITCQGMIKYLEIKCMRSFKHSLCELGSQYDPSLLWITIQIPPVVA